MGLAGNKEGDTDSSSAVGMTEHKWLLWNFWMIALKLGSFSCDGMLRALAIAAPVDTVWFGEHTGRQVIQF